MKKKFLFLLISLLFVFLLTGASCINKQANDQVNNQNVVGNDRDLHGCIGSAGYRWCESSQKCLRIWEEGCLDEIATLFEQLKKTTSIPFGEILNNTELTWMVKVGEQDLEYKLPAQQISAQEFKPEDINKVYNFFLTNGFSKDQNNQVIKSLAGNSVGFSHAGVSLVCGVGDQEKNLTAVCALWNQNMITTDSTKEEITKLFAEKYNKKIEDVNLTINKQVEDYLSGGVKFGADQNAEGGIFLAMKVNDVWQLVYDGNGSIDCQKMRGEYKFPDEILKPNFCD